MKIRTRLTLTFALIVTVILLIVTSSIYFFFDNFRHVDFDNRLRNRALRAAAFLRNGGVNGVALLAQTENGSPTNLPDQHTLVFSDRFRKIYDSQPDRKLFVDTTLLRATAVNQEVHYRYSGLEVIGILSKSPVGTFYIVAAARDVPGHQALGTLLDILVFVFLVSIIFVLLLGWIYAGKVLSPITRVISDVEQISGTDLSFRLDEGRQQDEIDKLSQTFNSMLERLNESFISQKNFISNASHELRTPIAVISAEIETALMQTNSEDKNYEILTSVLANSKRLGVLAGQLLLLAQATARHSNKSFSSMRVDQALWDAKFELDKSNSEYNIVIDFDIGLEEEELSILGDEALIKVVFLNLMDNACKYSPGHDAIVRLGRTSSALTIEFENPGMIASEDLGKIFAPFFRGSNAKSTRGNGIGLSLAKEVIKLHDGDLSVASADGRTIFVIRFYDMES